MLPHPVPHLNDCAPALVGLEKGSSRSPRLQSVAERIHMAAIPRRIQLGFLHASGEQLILEGIDDGSRKHAMALLGPACGPDLKQIVFEFAEAQSPGTTIDFFAASCNAVVERFAAWTTESGAELVDAFTSRSWDHGMCVCGRRHRETGFFFPPNGLEERVVRRAKSDGARGIFFLPTNRKAAYFMCLTQSAYASRVIGQAKGLFIHTGVRPAVGSRRSLSSQLAGDAGDWDYQTQAGHGAFWPVREATSREAGGNAAVVCPGYAAEGGSATHQDGTARSDVPVLRFGVAQNGEGPDGIGGAGPAERHVATTSIRLGQDGPGVAGSGCQTFLRDINAAGGSDCGSAGQNPTSTYASTERARDSNLVDGLRGSGGSPQPLSDCSRDSGVEAVKAAIPLESRQRRQFARKSVFVDSKCRQRSREGGSEVVEKGGRFWAIDNEAMSVEEAQWLYEWNNPSSSAGSQDGDDSSETGRGPTEGVTQLDQVHIHIQGGPPGTLSADQKWARRIAQLKKDPNDLSGTRAAFGLCSEEDSSSMDEAGETADGETELSKRLQFSALMSN